MAVWLTLGTPNNNLPRNPKCVSFDTLCKKQQKLDKIVLIAFAI